MTCERCSDNSSSSFYNIFDTVLCERCYYVAKRIFRKAFLYTNNFTENCFLVLTTQSNEISTNAEKIKLYHNRG